MGRHRNAALALAGALVAASCGSGGGGTGGSNGASPAASGDLTLVEHLPAADAVQVPLDAVVWARFDGVLVGESVVEEGAWLATAAGERVPGSFAFENGGREVRFTPSAALQPETDYVFTFSPFVSDTAGRILAERHDVRFRTIDHTPPRLIASSVADNQTGVDRLAPFELTFDEPLAPASLDETTVYLRDLFGGSYPCALSLVDGTKVVVAPLADLAGDRRYRLIVAGGTRGPTDRAGNVFAQSWSATFRTAVDTTAPRLLSVWPPVGTAISPHACPELFFDESVDPASVEPTTVTLTDAHGNAAHLRVTADPDQRRLRLVPSAPLPKGATVRLEVAGGPSGLTDLSGNPLASGTLVEWTVGSDDVPPAVVGTLPSDREARVSLNVQPTITFDEPLDRVAVHGGSVVLRDGHGPVAARVTLADGDTRIVVEPDDHLRRDTEYVCTVYGGPAGIRDRAGNVLARDVVITFRTADDATLPDVILLPGDGAAAVPTSTHLSALFDTPFDPATVTDDVMTVTTRDGVPVAGRVEVLRANRTLRFVPRDPWTPGGWYRVTLRGGPEGVREASGNWLAGDRVHEFRIGFQPDVQVPSVRVSLNAAADARRDNMQVPPSGFTVDLFAQDPTDYAVDPTSFELLLAGPGPTPTADEIFARATVARDRLQWKVPADAALQPGEYELHARASDLSGNLAVARSIRFTVVIPAANKVPFERTHVVWVRTDLDRDGNGRSDFFDDLLKLGFVTADDPLGLNERMVEILRDGVIAQANRLFGRAADGSGLGDGTVAIRFTTRRPPGVAHMQIALGGLDPEGPPRRDYGAESTGVLGRAYFDMYNSQVNDLNIASRPGLGVFPGELFLFQAGIHQRVFPAFTTTFARRFLNLAPAMGGTPVGHGPHDAAVVAPGFDYVAATPEQRVRFDAVFRAADDWATAVGIILAHEVGHAVGLVAEGPSPFGLHGDASLHDEGAGVADVMAPAVGYDSLISLDYAFRDLDLAYLRHRLVLK